MAKLPPIPVGVPPGHSFWNDWYEKLRKLINDGFEWTNITGTPTTLAGYGITDAAPYMDTVTALSSSSGVVNINCTLGDYFTLALTENVTSITFSNLPGSGKGASKLIRITQDSTPRTVTWPSSFKWAGGSAGTVSTGSGDVDFLAITSFDNGSNWLATFAGDFS